MTILLKNLTARIPRMQDRAALVELVRLCEGGKDSIIASVLEDGLSLWQQLHDDAWVIVTTDDQLVGFARCWREEDTCMTTYLCVHPEYRCRGIGTLLLRMVEMRARQYARQYTHQIASEQCVVLQGFINSADEGARHLFEREGYQMGHSFLRISFALRQEDGQQDVPVGARKFIVDVDLEQRNQPLVTTSLTEQDVLCNVHLYQRYAKELCPASRDMSQMPANLQAVGA